MKKIFYEKRGRKYIPVSEYDNELMDSYTKGTHLVMSYPGGVSRVFNIDPDYASMIAAGRVAEDAISKAILDASNLRLGRETTRTPLTEEQLVAWNALIDAFGPSARQLEWPAARDIAEAAVTAMRKEADKLMVNPAVQKAFNHFQMICDLTKESGVK